MVNKDFENFQKYFKEYQKLFGLTGYKVYFKYEPIDPGFADITINLEGMVATVRLNSELPDKDKPFRDIEMNAKHEAIHLLVARLEENGRYRFATGAEISEATEELVRKIEGLVKVSRS